MIFFEFHIGRGSPKGFLNEGSEFSISLLADFRFLELMRDQSVDQIHVHVATVLQGIEVEVLRPRFVILRKKGRSPFVNSSVKSSG